MVQIMRALARFNQQLLRFLFTLYRSKWTVHAVVVVLFILSVTAIPFLVTFDGHNYLAGSQVLFTDRAADNFWWLREPGYSMFIKVIRGIFGPSEIFLTLIQTGMTVFGGIFAMKGIWLAHHSSTKIPPGLMAASLVLGVGNASVLYYSSSALQQPFFVLTTGWVIYLSAQIYVKPKTTWLLVTVISLIVVALVQEEFARLMTIPVLLAFLTRRTQPESSRIEIKFWPSAKLLAKTATIFVALNVIVTLALIPWAQYRDTQLARQTIAAEFKDNSFAPLSTQIKGALNTKEPHPHSVLSHLGAFIGFSGSSQFLSKHYERKIYIQYRQNTVFRCGAIEGMPESFSRVESISNAVLQPACRSKRAIDLIKPYTRVSTLAYPFILSAGLLLSLINIWRRKMLVPSLSLLALTGAYCLLGFGADRYSVPLIPICAAIIVITAHSLLRPLKTKINMRLLIGTHVP